MLARKVREDRRGPFGMMSPAWVKGVLAVRGCPAATKVAAVLAARVGHETHAALLTSGHIAELAGVHRCTMARAVASLKSHGLLAIREERPDDARAGRRVWWVLEGDGLVVRPEGRQHVRVYKNDTLAGWFAEAQAAVVRTWLAHLLYVNNGLAGSRRHGASVTTIAAAAHQTQRTERRNTRWLEAHDVLTRRQPRYRGVQEVTFAEPPVPVERPAVASPVPDLLVQFRRSQAVLSALRLDDADAPLLYYEDRFAFSERNAERLPVAEIAHLLAINPGGRHKVKVGGRWVNAAEVVELANRAGEECGWTYDGEWPCSSCGS